MIDAVIMFENLDGIQRFQCCKGKIVIVVILVIIVCRLIYRKTRDMRTSLFLNIFILFISFFVFCLLLAATSILLPHIRKTSKKQLDPISSPPAQYLSIPLRQEHHHLDHGLERQHAGRQGRLEGERAQIRHHPEDDGTGVEGRRVVVSGTAVRSRVRSIGDPEKVGEDLLVPVADAVVV